MTLFKWMTNTLPNVDRYKNNIANYIFQQNMQVDAQQKIGGYTIRKLYLPINWAFILLF